jgi:hypothetical protein
LQLRYCYHSKYEQQKHTHQKDINHKGINQEGRCQKEDHPEEGCAKEGSPREVRSQKGYCSAGEFFIGNPSKEEGRSTAEVRNAKERLHYCRANRSRNPVGNFDQLSDWFGCRFGSDEPLVAEGSRQANQVAAIQEVLPPVGSQEEILTTKQTD